MKTAHSVRARHLVAACGSVLFISPAWAHSGHWGWAFDVMPAHPGPLAAALLAATLGGAIALVALRRRRA